AVVAAVYPLAWAAGSVGGDDVAVTDLTPPGTEAHDASLSAVQRSELQHADLVLLLPLDGFQPEVEEAAREAEGVVLRVPGEELVAERPEQDAADPHLWLDPEAMARAVGEIGAALGSIDPPRAGRLDRRAEEAESALLELSERYREGLTGCAYLTLIVTHEAFGYLADRYGLEQLGIAGLSPESEPSADRLRAVARAVAEGRAGAVFFEATAEGRRVGESVASDLGVPALPLSTLESRPAEGDYVTVMDENLASLREGLGCEGAGS
ncbi:MAG: zinc ABC transporter substrate-binding protein, partial [Actinobacteria bacterium]|nr:zinc ABC transporter substrate-binding protein [Actinomycetota bacterium]